MKIWHDHSTVEGHSTLLVNVAFMYNININRTPSSSSDSSESEQVKNIKKSVFRFMIPRADGHEKERSAPENMAWGTIMCMFGMPYHAITAHLGDKTGHWTVHSC